MSSEDIWLALLSFILPFVLFFFSSTVIKRHENCIDAFYCALREEYSGSYIKQNKPVSFLRKCYGLDIRGTIHWMIGFFHYLQIYMVSSPILMLLSSLFLPLNKVIIMCLIFGQAVPYALISINCEVLTLLQVHRCRRIKKTNPKYSKREIKPWRGHHL